MFFVDTYEPIDIEDGVKQFLPDVMRDTLNIQGLGDYYWETDHTITMERKDADDLIGSIVSGSLELRLRKCLKNADETGLVVERFITPWYGGCATWKQAKNRKVFYPVMKHPKLPYSEVMSLLYRLGKMGIDVYWTASLRGTVIFLASAYTNSFKLEEEHAVLRRYVKEKPLLAEFDPYVLQLMSIPGIGEKTAKKLLEVYSAPIQVYTAKESILVKLVGKSVTKAIKETIYGETWKPKDTF